MIDETAVVRSSSERSIEVQIMAPGVCDACEIREQCFRNDGLISVPRHRLSNPDQIDIAAGTRIRLRIANSSVLAVTAIVYGVPLLSFMIGLFIGYDVVFVRSTETLRALASFALATGTTLLAGIGILYFDRRVAGNIRYQVHNPESVS